MAVKRARFTVQTVEITCPYCYTTIVEPNSGSHFWEVAEINTPSLVCTNCDKRLLAPKV